MPEPVSLAQLRSNLAAYVDQVCETGEPLRIVREDARGAVLLSEQDYEGFLETLHIMSSPENAARVLDSIRELNEGRGIERDLIDPEGAPSRAA